LLNKPSGNNISGIIGSIVGLGTVLVVGLIVVGQIQEQLPVNSTEYNMIGPVFTMLPSILGVVITMALAFVVTRYAFRMRL
jgi:hypothetical protein